MEDDIKKEEGRWRAVGCGGWRNSVSHEIELAVCNTFGFEEDALPASYIELCTGNGDWKEESSRWRVCTRNFYDKSRR